MTYHPNRSELTLPNAPSSHIACDLENTFNLELRHDLELHCNLEVTHDLELPHDLAHLKIRCLQENPGDLDNRYSQSEISLIYDRPIPRPKHQERSG